MQLVAARWTAQENKDLVVVYANNRAFLLIQLHSHQGACWHGWVFVVFLSTHPAHVDLTDQLTDLLKRRALGCAQVQWYVWLWGWTKPLQANDVETYG